VPEVEERDAGDLRPGSYLDEADDAIARGTEAIAATAPPELAIPHSTSRRRTVRLT
jgi:hypothetical protein